jgi:hypothetical protein
MIKKPRADAREDRNDKIVALHDLDPKKYSFGNLAKKFRISKASVHEIYVREKARRGDKDAMDSKLVRSKYPALHKLSTV